MMENIQGLNFGVSWESREDFPSVQSDEAQARRDMQLLHDKTAEYINGTIVPVINDVLLPAVENPERSIRTAATITTAWTGSSIPYKQSIAVDGVTANSIVEVSLPSTATVAQVEAYQNLCLQDGGQDDGSITLHCFGTKSTVSIPVNIVIRRD